MSNSNTTGFDGHINRNIRLAMALIDMAKPYIHIERITKITVDGTDKLSIDFNINGCIDIAQVYWTQNGTTIEYLPGGTGEEYAALYCNYMVPEDEQQTLFTVEAEPHDVFNIYAIVDQEWSTSENADSVAPQEVPAFFKILDNNDFCAFVPEDPSCIVPNVSAVDNP